MAKEWVEQNLPSGEKIALDVPFFMPRLEPTLGQLEQKRRKILSSSQPNNNQLRRLDLLISLAQKEKGKRYELYYLHSAAAGDGFLFSRPAVPYDLDHLRKAGIRNVVVAKINPKENSKFCEELQTKAGLLARLSPFKDENRRWAVDPLPLTGAPFLLKDLLSRHRNGQIIEIYRLETFLHLYLYLYLLFLRMSDCKYGAWRLLEHLLCCAPEEDPVYSSPSMSSHYNHVNSLFFSYT